MPGLREIQKRFSANIFDTGSVEIQADVKSGIFEPDLRLQVYRNNVFTGFTGALRAVYPVVEKLVGDGFFLYACNEFIARHPSNSGDLHDFGGEFGLFLASFEPAGSLPYLPDVAQFEWHFHMAYHEADAGGLDFDVLGTIPAEQHERLRFKINPASRLMKSEFPIIEIWRVNQEGYQGDQAVDLGAGGVSVLTLRQGEKVEMIPLDAGDFEMLQRITRGDALGDCLGSVLDIDPDFDLTGFLSRFVANNTLAGFTVS
jgi:hypothetical protein